MYRTYNFRPASPPAPCLVMPGAIAKGLSPIKLKPTSKSTFENSVVLRTVQPRSKRPTKSNNNKNNDNNNHNAEIMDQNKKSGFKEYTFILPSTTDHYSHWCDSKSCSSRISSGNLKDNVLGNLEVPNLYTTVTPKSFLPPSPLRAKQFVMPLKLHQLEPQKKPTAPTSDLTVTFVHRKMSDSSSNSKVSCHRSGATSKQSKSSANSSKQTSKHTDTTTQAHSQAGYPDPLEHAPMAFISRLAEMTSHQADTVRFERNKRGKGRTRIS
ncbi:hypothetical protein ACHWQZ_G017873 [Mnemiopsis leidyi]